MASLLNIGRGLVNHKFLPYDYEVEYLESNSTQWIDTGISGGANDLEIGCKFRYTKFAANGAIYGNWIDDSHNTTRFIITSYAKGLFSNNRLSNTGGNTTVDMSMNTIHTFVSQYTTYTTDGITNIVTQTASGIANNGNIVLFNRSVANPNTSRDIGLKVYSFYIKKSGSLVRDFIPVVKDNIGYMYDKISGRLFGNAGTSSFIIGPRV